MKTLPSKLLLLFLSMMMSVNCGTIIHGTTQEVSVASSPDEAEVWVDGARVGKTPTRLELKRKNDYLVRFVKEGYKPVEVKITSSTSAWIIGNVVFGGIIGCTVDLISGGAYELSPERVDVNLTEADALNGKTIFIDAESLFALKQIRFLDDQGRPEIVVDLVWVE
jgi:hypothetical protein